VHTGICGVPEALVRLQAHNAEMRRVGARIEKVFGPCKRLYGVGRMRWLGMARAGLQVRLAAMTHARWRARDGGKARGFGRGS
jgi:IS5 family transposase